MQCFYDSLMIPPDAQGSREEGGVTLFHPGQRTPAWQVQRPSEPKRLARLALRGILPTDVIGALGKIQIDMMREQGYKDSFSAGICMAAATLGKDLSKAELVEALTAKAPTLVAPTTVEPLAPVPGPPDPPGTVIPGAPVAPGQGF